MSSTRHLPGDVIVVAGFGQGSDVIVLRTTDAVVAARPASTVSDLLAAGVTGRSYAQMASFYDEIDARLGNARRARHQDGAD